MSSYLKEYFADLLENALKEEEVNIENISKDYIANMLGSFMYSEALFSIKKNESGTPSLTWLYEKAVNSSGSQRLVAYQHLGDTALFVSGFFNDHIRNSSVGTKYYIDMGCAAYNAASITRSSSVFYELSNKFSSLVNVIACIADQTTMQREENALDLLEKYNDNSNSKMLIKKLIKKGVIPIFGKSLSED